MSALAIRTLGAPGSGREDPYGLPRLDEESLLIGERPKLGHDPWKACQLRAAFPLPP